MGLPERVRQSTFRVALPQAYKDLSEVIFLISRPFICRERLRAIAAPCEQLRS
jgi:hypothetical protein